jgi:hypothetical protein
MYISVYCELGSMLTALLTVLQLMLTAVLRRHCDYQHFTEEEIRAL